MTEPRRRLIIDAMNVIGSRPNGWWRDRDGAARTLLTRLASLAASEGIEVTAVLDGRPLQEMPEGEHRGVHVVYARRPGRDAADDRIVELVAEDADVASLEVVTSDRGLAERVRAHGASVRGTSTLLARLDAIEA
jgi:predicted RNA-binding protein with PIN domain